MTNPRTETVTHLSPEALAGYLDDGLPRDERREAELHLAACAECREELVEGRRVERAQRRRRWAPVLLPATAAAAVLLAVVLPRQSTTPSDIRSGAEGDHLSIVSPEPSHEVAPGTITFIWRSAGPGASYTLTLQEPDGRMVWSTAAADTLAILPDSIALAPGRTWFWFVDALLPNGPMLSTGVQRLRTAR
jgi:anti-sigma factor RsiW